MLPIGNCSAVFLNLEKHRELGMNWMIQLLLQLKMRQHAYSEPFGYGDNPNGRWNQNDLRKNSAG
jgi:hypothetical protein